MTTEPSMQKAVYLDLLMKFYYRIAVVRTLETEQLIKHKQGLSNISVNSLKI